MDVEAAAAATFVDQVEHLAQHVEHEAVVVEQQHATGRGMRCGRGGWLHAGKKSGVWKEAIMAKFFSSVQILNYFGLKRCR
jgi:hypothetical protein